LYSPFRLAGIGTAINAIMPSVPLLQHLGFTAIVILAPVADEGSEPSITVVVPARNERGNIEPALVGLRAARPELPGLEVIFVEGHSTDGTWEEIERLAPAFERHFRVRALRQRGQGKGDAVRLGFSQASGDLLTILDADLTMPPALLGRFYEAYRQGHGELVNGSRLVYASEDDAMRFLNRLANVLFAKALSRVLSVRLGDSLCGTKLVARHDYARFTAWRRDFGDFDPFGDFELLFPAAMLGLTIVDVPVRYGARSYGSTSISRFRHGWMLLKMTLVGFFKVRLGRVR
jgi:glycosyltransferase involved in cell wall biosynthesis